MKRIKKGDTVIVVAGKNKKSTGVVKLVRDNKVIVEGLNLVKKHVKPNPKLEQEGGIFTKENPIHISNVALYNDQTQKADKVGFRFIEKDGKKYKIRYFKSDDRAIDNI